MKRNARRPRTSRLSPAVSSRALALIHALGVCAVSTAAMPSRAQIPEKQERIEVTGTRISTSDEESASPVAIFDAEDIRSEGYPSIEFFLNNLPQVFAGQGNRWGNSASGTATVDLRGMGPGRTLVLVNGRRIPAGSASALAPDLNQIPAALIRRVDVVTGGASAVYGSDAIAGVVNFILNDRFEGVQGDVSHSFYNHRQKSVVADALRARDFEVPGDKGRDGTTTAANLTLGGNFPADKGNATVFLGYLKSDELLHADRDYSACAFNAITSRCDGVIAGYPGAFAELGAGRTWTIAQDSGRIRPWSEETDLYNFAPLNHFQRPAERYNLAAFANHEITANVRAYAEFGFHDDRTVAQIGPTAVFGNEVLLRYENPLLTEDWRARLDFRGEDGAPASGPGSSARVTVFRRNVEGGPRQSEIRHTSYREVLGVTGALDRAWDYDLYLQHGKVNYQRISRGDFSFTRVGRALDVLEDPATGAPVCASVLDGTDPACIPYDVWSLGGVTPQAVAYLQTTAMQEGFTSQRIVGATLRGDLGSHGVRVPGSGSGVEVVFGLERRSERLEFEPDAASSDLSGGPSGPAQAGSFSVNEAFGEIRAPIGSSSSLNGSYRISDYSTGKTTRTFGVGFNFSPAPWARIRGGYQRAIRAPDLFELYDPQVIGGGFGFDPCAGESPSRSLADCARSGVVADQYGRILQIPQGLGAAVLFGGNPDLEPETASTRTVGLAFMPRNDLTATIDFFDIRLEDRIGFVLSIVSLRECLNTGNPVFCSRIRRDPSSGSLWFGSGQIAAINANVGTSRVSGVDVALSHSRKLHGVGTLAFEALGTYLMRREFEPYPGPGAFDCVGLHGTNCGVPTPRWRHRARLSWAPSGKLRLDATWRYFHSIKDAGGSSHPLLSAPATDVNPDMRAMNYFDLAASWQATRNLSVRGGINNVADRDPPLGGIGVNGNTWSQTYDALGRYVFLAASIRF